MCVAFDVPGVKEHAYFLKDVRDARAIRAMILECEFCLPFFVFVLFVVILLFELYGALCGIIRSLLRRRIRGGEPSC